MRISNVFREKFNQKGNFLRSNNRLYLQFKTFFRRIWPVWIFPPPVLIRHLEPDQTIVPGLRWPDEMSWQRGDVPRVVPRVCLPLLIFFPGGGGGGVRWERESFQEVQGQHAVLRQLFRFLPRRMQQKKLIAFVTEETVDRLSVFLLNLFWHHYKLLMLRNYIPCRLRITLEKNVLVSLGKWLLKGFLYKLPCAT